VWRGHGGRGGWCRPAAKGVAAAGACGGGRPGLTYAEAGGDGQGGRGVEGPVHDSAEAGSGAGRPAAGRSGRGGG
jgi:hypothetical protein